MPNKPINFEFTSETDKYEKGLKDAERATRKFGDTLETDIPRASEQMADKAEADFDRVEREARDAGKETGRNFSQSLGEGLGSGDLSEVVQETLGEAVGSMSGPVSAAVGIIAGAGLLIWNKFKEDSEKVQAAIVEQTESMWGTLLSSIEGKIGEAFIRINKESVVVEELHNLWQDEPEGMTKMVEDAEKLGISAWDVTRARAGDEEALRRVKTQVDGVLETMNLTTTESRDQIDAAREIQSGWEISEESVAKAKTQVQAYNDSVKDLVGTIGTIPREIPMTIKVDASSLNQYTGGAYALSGGGRTVAVYAPRESSRESP